MLKCNTNEYATILSRCFDKKSPLYVYGAPGIGKSEIPRQVLPSKAKAQNREYVEWDNLSIEEKHNCIDNPSKYFVLCDQRIAQMDTTDLRGIPNLLNKEMLECIPMSWIIYFTQPEASGSIFFDEMNLAAPAVAGQAYQIINERSISDRRVSDDVWIFGAGNRLIDRANVMTMPLPLRDRFNEFELYPSVDSWTKWATGKINSHLIAFVNWKESYLNFDPSNIKNNDEKYPTPRGIVRANSLLGDDIDITSDDANTFISIAVGDAFAVEFQGYVKHFRKINWTKLYKKPEIVEGWKSDLVWALIGGMSEQIAKGINKKRFEQMIDVVFNLTEDFAVVCLRMLKDGNEDEFKSLFTTLAREKQQILMDKYWKYIINSSC